MRAEASEETGADEKDSKVYLKHHLTRSLASIIYLISENHCLLENELTSFVFHYQFYETFNDDMIV